MAFYSLVKSGSLPAAITKLLNYFAATPQSFSSLGSLLLSPSSLSCLRAGGASSGSQYFLSEFIAAIFGRRLSFQVGERYSACLSLVAIKLVIEYLLC